MLQEAITYKLNIDRQFNESELLKGIYITLIHATRIPPHIGMIMDKKYHSLSIKGRDINTPVPALIKNSSIRKISTLFIKIKSHPTFSETYLREHFITNVEQFERVDIGVATCLSPIKLFFEEVYNLQLREISYLYELLPLLDAEGLIDSVSSLNVDQNSYNLPIYTNKEINEGIASVRNEYKDRVR
jgi:hypothetical protein